MSYSHLRHHQLFLREHYDPTPSLQKIIWWQEVMLHSRLHRKLHPLRVVMVRLSDFRLKNRVPGTILSVDQPRTHFKWVQTQAIIWVIITFLTSVTLNKATRILSIIIPWAAIPMLGHAHKVPTLVHKIVSLRKGSSKLIKHIRPINPLDLPDRHQTSTFHSTIRPKEMQVQIKRQDLEQ